MKIVKGNMKSKKLSKQVEDRPKLSLPTAKSEPSDSLQDYSILIYGPKKIGKTSLTAQFEGALSFMTEPGGKAQSIYQVSCKTWPDLREYTRLFVKDGRFRTGIVDTVDLAYDLCFNWVCKKKVIDHPSDEAFGKGWRGIKDEFTSWVVELLHSGKGVIFISHTKTSEIKTRRGESFSKTGSSMSGQASEIIEGLVDIWGSYDYDGKKRYLTIGGSDEVDAGCRVENHFINGGGEVLDRIPMGRNAKEAYRNFVAAFNNELHGELEEAAAPAKKKLVLRKK